LKSPDRADALCLAAAGVLYGNVLSPTPILVGVGQSYWGIDLEKAREKIASDRQNLLERQ
jgi:hypothetical protein